MNTTWLSLPFWGSIALLVAVAAFNSWLSRINQFFFFSRTVAAGFASTPGAKKIAADYLRGVWLGCVAGVGVSMCMAGMTRFSLYLCFTAGLLAQCVYTSVAFARAHRLTGMALESGAAETPETAPAPAATVSVPLLDPGRFTRGLMMQMVVAPLCAALAWLVPMVTMRVGFGELAGSISAHGADFLSGLGMGLLAGSVLLFLQLKYFSRHRSRLAHFTANSCVLLAWCGAAAIAVSTFCVPFDWTITRHEKQIILGVVLGVAVLRMIYGYLRSRQFAPPQVERGGDRFWRWGLFYYNPGDPTLFIQHRAGPGYTVNFANFLSWPLTLAVLADFVFLVSIHPYR